MLRLPKFMNKLKKLVKESKELTQIKNIGKRMQDSISEYFYQTNQNDPTTYFD